MEFYGSCHNHTDRSNFRLRDSTNRLDELCWYAADKLKHNFIAITDHETISTAIDCQKVEKDIREKYPDFKVIRGNEIYLCRNELNKDNYVRGEDRFWHFILLAKDLEGHRQIRQISTRAWSHCFKQGKMIRVPTYYSDLQEIIGSNPGHVIFSQACLGSRLAHLALDYADNPADEQWEYLKQWIEHIQAICGKENYFLEVQPSFNKEQITVNKIYRRLSEELGVPVVISLDAHYLKKEHQSIHHAFLTAQEGERETSEFYATTYMMSREEIHSYMDESLGKDTVTLWMNNTKMIYDMCEDFDLTKPLHIPYLPLTVDTLTEKEYLYYKDKIKELEYFYTSEYQPDRDMAAAIIRKILSDPEQYDNQATYEMIDDNLSTIRITSDKQNTRWSAYLLNMRDYISTIWNKGDSLVGCSRGSGGGFLLLNMLDITQINPLREKAPLRSWRFLNPERASVVDIDIDIEGGKRPQVYKALQDTYGADRVSKVLTIRTEKPKSAILTACFKEGTLINTLNGEKPIEEITENDYVDTLDGFTKVLAPTYFIGKPEIKIKTKNSENPFFYCTPEHKILTITKFNKHRLKGSNISSYVKELFPELKEHKATDSIYQTYVNHCRAITPEWTEAKDIEKNVHYGLVPIDTNIVEVPFIEWKNDFHKKYGVGISTKIPVNEDFCELIGIWIAEGSILTQDRGIAFTIHQKEENLKKRIISLMWKIFKVDNFGIYERQDSLAVTIQYSSSQLGAFFKQLFIDYEDIRSRPDFHRRLTQWGKRIPKILRNIDPYLQLQIFKGWFIGDGYASLREGCSTPQSKATTVSKDLAYDMIRILHRNYLNPSVDYEAPRSSDHCATYNLTFYSNKARKLYHLKYETDLTERLKIVLDDRGDKDIPVVYQNKLYMRAKLEKEQLSNIKDEKVYCLSMPKENFCVNHLIVHNCRGLGIDPDEANYLASFIKSDRGQQRTLEQTYYGDEENDIKPDMKFRELMDGKYKDVWEVAQFISGLCCGIGSHAGGVIFYDEPITNSTALMQTSNGDVVTQYDLHRLEEVSLIKIDLLSIEALDRIRACLDLLGDYKYINNSLSLRERYENTIGVYKIDRTSPEMWKMIHEHKIESLFQMEQQSGIKGIAATKPTTLEELATLNSVIRLMASEKGAEQPIDKFARFKKDINEWYAEMRQYGLTQEEQDLLKPLLLESAGICEAQEKFMSLVQMPEAGGFSLAWSDKLRKSIAKKNPAEFEKLQAEYFETTRTKNLSANFCNYVWNVLVCTSRGYGFNLSHTLGYSLVALQEMNLAYHYPIIFWDTANLIVDSGSMNLTLDDDDDVDNDEENEVEEKVKNSSTDYGKIATAIGKMKARGLSFSLPDINKSTITFSPDLDNNRILYGMRGITNIGNQLIKDIFKNRPYISIEDFQEKVKVKKPQMVNLIKAGAFDALYQDLTREEIMQKYIESIADQKKRITLQNMNMLILKGLIPEDLDYQRRIYNFTKYVRKKKNDNYYILDDVSYNFFKTNYDEDKLVDIEINNEEVSAKLPMSLWDNIYEKEMNKVRAWMKDNQQDILNNLNSILFKETFDKYAASNISKWEMDSLSFYYHDHELANLQNGIYEVDDYSKLPDEPEIDKQFPDSKGTGLITMYKIHRIAGTVIDKNKDKSIVTLLTPSGVVTVKVWKNQFAAWDKQISQIGDDGKKHVIEKSFFTRGNKLIITGIKRENTFVPKKYKSTEFPLFEKIISINEKGIITESVTERAEVDE